MDKFKPTTNNSDTGVRMNSGKSENTVDASDRENDTDVTINSGKTDDTIGATGRDDERKREREIDYPDPADIDETFDPDDPDFFADDDNDEDYQPALTRPWIRKTIVIVASFMLFANLLAFWPHIYNAQAIQFLKKNRELSRNENIQTYKQAIVAINTQDRKGTGFNVAPRGLIITNQHIVENAKTAVVSFDHGKSYPADVIASNEAIDIAILQLRRTDVNDGVTGEGGERTGIGSNGNVTGGSGDQLTVGSNGSVADGDGDRFDPLPTLEIAQHNEWIAGDSVYVIGNPLSFFLMANEGTVLGLTPVGDNELPVVAIQAPIYKGNSGSPVIDMNGQVIAVVFATANLSLGRNSERTKVGLAIPVDYVRPYLESAVHP